MQKRPNDPSLKGMITMKRREFLHFAAGVLILLGR
jgi:hypothetical protein